MSKESRAEHLAGEIADAEADGRGTDAARLGKHLDAERAAAEARGQAGQATPEQAAAQRAQADTPRRARPAGRRRAAPGNT